jgi:hypothetical protein
VPRAHLIRFEIAVAGAIKIKTNDDAVIGLCLTCLRLAGGD